MPTIIVPSPSTITPTTVVYIRAGMGRPIAAPRFVYTGVLAMPEVLRVGPFQARREGDPRLTDEHMAQSFRRLSREAQKEANRGDPHYAARRKKSKRPEPLRHGGAFDRTRPPVLNADGTQKVNGKGELLWGLSDADRYEGSVGISYTEIYAPLNNVHEFKAPGERVEPSKCAPLEGVNTGVRNPGIGHYQASTGTAVSSYREGRAQSGQAAFELPKASRLDTPEVRAWTAEVARLQKLADDLRRKGGGGAWQRVKRQLMFAEKDLAREMAMVKNAGGHLTIRLETFDNNAARSSRTLTNLEKMKEEGKLPTARI